MEMNSVAPGFSSPRPAKRSLADRYRRDLFADGRSLPSREEEIWIVARSKEFIPQKDNNTPRTGALMTKLGKDKKEIPLPLKHTDVNASVAGYIASVEVTQQFQNPYDGKIEAVYIFPLPENAAVNEFIMTIGKRKIRGIIREREEAEQIYQEAKSQGYVASLLTQERPNVFTQSVANIEPGKRIDVTIKYFNTLAYVDGWYEFVFPMVVGPRFNPPGSTDGIGAVARGKHGISGQKTEVQYLKPGERSGHDISLKLDINAGVKIEELVCNSHVIQQEKLSSERVSVSIAPNDSIPNKDFVLRYRVAGERIKSNLITHHDERGGFFTLMLYPPQDLEKLSRAPMEMVFVLDCSGSMNGKPIAQAKTAIERALKHLQDGDSFQIINFSEHASALGPKPLEATPENIQRGLDYLKKLNSDGGTMMIEGIKAALDFPHDEERLRFVSFMTDGYIGNEAEILKAVHEKIGASRIFSFGVGSSPNRYLLDSMAKIGRGAVAYLGLNDSAAEIMDSFFERISHPALRDIEIDWGKMKVKNVYPRSIPDLFVGRPVILTGRFEGEPSTIRVSGRSGSEKIEFNISGKSKDALAKSEGLPSVWARMKIAELADRSLWSDVGNLPKQIKQTALDYNLMSAYTAFVAADSSRKTKGEEGTTVPVAVPVPDGVKYKTAVQGK
jgi:Ca-activated chloride channel family protein